MNRKLTNYKTKKKKRINYYKDSGVLDGKHIKIKCTKCKRIQKLTVNDLAIYTEEVINSYVCWRCG